MGNSSSNKSEFNNCGGIQIQLIKQNYYSLDNVTGFIHLQIINTFQGRDLFIKVKGFEAVRYQFDTHENHNQNHIVEGKKYLFQKKLLMYQFGGDQILPGCYSFPFQFVLPNNLPVSFVDQNQYYSAKIQYKVKGEISLKKNEKSKIKNTAFLKIIDTPKKQIIKIEEGRKFSPETCFCCEQGITFIKCNINVNTFIPGEQVQIQTEVNNEKGDLKINHLTYTLIKKFRLQSLVNSDPSYSDQEEICKINSIQSVNSKENKKLIDSIKLVNSIGVNSLQPSCQSQMIQLEYLIHIKPSFDSFFLFDQYLSINIPIQIVNVPNNGNSNLSIAVPQNWNPIVEKEFNFTIFDQNSNQFLNNSNQNELNSNFQIQQQNNFILNQNLPSYQQNYNQLQYNQSQQPIIMQGYSGQQPLQYGQIQQNSVINYPQYQVQSIPYIQPPLMFNQQQNFNQIYPINPLQENQNQEQQNLQINNYSQNL